MDLGLEEAGFENVGCIEIDETARATLRLNRPSWKMIGDGDITSVAQYLRPEDLGLKTGELDLLAGGPPCQPFSAAAQWATTGRQGMRDERARTVDATMRLVGTFLPKAILMENVLGFVSGKGAAIGYLEEQLGIIGQHAGVEYSVHWRLLNAADYGVPQNRRRVIVVALRDGIPWEWPKPTHLGSYVRAWDVLSDLPPGDLPEPNGKWAELLPSIPEGQNYQWLTKRGGGDEIFGYRTKYWNFLLKLAKDRPSWTLSASPGPSTGPFHWDNRPLSVREQLRLQTFPDAWQLSGEYRAQTKQAGNATPALLAEVVGRQLAACLRPCGDRPSAPHALLRSRKAELVPAPLEPSPIPERFANMRGPKKAHAGEGLGPAAVSSQVANAD
ncbi:DNA cytosine methyltransferase [Salinibacterium sp. SWN248]|nr:DNA cytosine methyltransferase [Salinibacterium sp. SWN248]